MRNRKRFLSSFQQSVFSIWLSVGSKLPTPNYPLSAFFITHPSSFYCMACIAVKVSVSDDWMSAPLVFSTGPRPGRDA